MNRRILLYSCFLPVLALFCSCSRYDHDKPDTEANRSGFHARLGLAPGDEVTGVYFYADEWGGDAAYRLAFTAPPEVIERIIGNLKLESAVYEADSTFMKDSFPWWNEQERRESKYYRYENNREEVLRHLWYHPVTQKCQVELVSW